MRTTVLRDSVNISKLPIIRLPAVPIALLLRPLHQGKACSRRSFISSSIRRIARPGHRSICTAQNGTDGEQEPVKGKAEFGYSRKDVILIGTVLTGFGYVMYYGLQATGMDAGMAGNWVQLIIVLGICIGWVGSYLWRVANKEMTYAKQLDDYEEAVMRKRLEEMPDAELDSVMAEIEREKEARRKGGSSL